METTQNAIDRDGERVRVFDGRRYDKMREREMEEEREKGRGGSKVAESEELLRRRD